MKRKRAKPSLTYHSDVDLDELEESDDEFKPNRSTRSGVIFYDVTESSSEEVMEISGDTDDDDNDDGIESDGENDDEESENESGMQQ